MADGLKVFRDVLVSTGDKQIKARRHVSFVDDFHEFVNQHADVVTALKADYADKLSAAVEEADVVSNFKEEATPEMLVVVKQILAGIEKYEELVTEVLKLIPKNDR